MKYTMAMATAAAIAMTAVGLMATKNMRETHAVLALDEAGFFDRQVMLPLPDNMIERDPPLVLMPQTADDWERVFRSPGWKPQIQEIRAKDRKA